MSAAFAGEGLPPLPNFLLAVVAGYLIRELVVSVRRRRSLSKLYDNAGYGWKVEVRMDKPDEKHDTNEVTGASPSPQSSVNEALTTAIPDFNNHVISLIREVQFDGAKEVVKKIVSVRDTYVLVASQKRADANVADSIVAMQERRLAALSQGDASILKLRDQVFCTNCHTNYSEFTYDVCPNCQRDNKQK